MSKQVQLIGQLDESYIAPKIMNWQQVPVGCPHGQIQI